VDYILAATVLLSVLFGVVRGFLRESVALLGWLVGLWLAWRYSHLLLPYLGGDLAGTELQEWVARALVLLATVIASWILGRHVELPRGSVRGSPWAWTGCSAACSAGRGAVIVGFAIMLGEAARLNVEPWWAASRLMPVGIEMAGVLRGYVETGREYVTESSPDA